MLLTIAVVMIGLVAGATVLTPTFRSGVNDLATDTRIMLETHEIVTVPGSGNSPPAVPGRAAVNTPRDLDSAIFSPSPDIMAGDVWDGFSSPSEKAMLAMMLGALMLSVWGGYELTQAERRWAEQAGKALENDKNMVLSAAMAIKAAGGDPRLAWQRLRHKQNTKAVWTQNQAEFENGLNDGVYRRPAPDPNPVRGA